MRVFLLLFSSLILDQASKIIVRNTMVIGQSIPILGNVLRLTYIENRGLAFGIQVANNLPFTILSILASVIIVIYLITHWQENMRVKCSLALILGGAFGNLIDRIAFRQVADFIDMGIGDLRWPVYNIADSVVVIGMFFLIYHILISEQKNKKIQEAND